MNNGQYDEYDGQYGQDSFGPGQYPPPGSYMPSGNNMAYGNNMPSGNNMASSSMPSGNNMSSSSMPSGSNMSGKSDSECGPDEEPGTLYGCKKKAKTCPGGAPLNWYGGCDTCEYGKVKNWRGVCVDNNPNGGGSPLSFIGFGGKKGKKGKKSKKNSSKAMIGGGNADRLSYSEMKKLYGPKIHGPATHAPVFIGGGMAGPATPYNPNIWTEPGQYPSAVGGRRRRKSKGIMTRKYKNKRTRKCKHRRSRKCNKK